MEIDVADVALDIQHPLFRVDLQAGRGHRRDSARAFVEEEPVVTVVVGRLAAAAGAIRIDSHPNGWLTRVRVGDVAAYQPFVRDAPRRPSVQLRRACRASAAAAADLPSVITVRHLVFMPPKPVVCPAPVPPPVPVMEFSGCSHQRVPKPIVEYTTAAIRDTASGSAT